MKQIHPKNLEKQLLCSLFLILLPVSVTAHGIDDYKSGVGIVIIVFTAVFLCFVAYIAYYIHRYGNGCLGAGTEHPNDTCYVKAEHKLDIAVVAALPSVRFSKIKAHKLHQGEVECVVCLSEFKDHEVLRVLPDCFHVFHTHCIEPWFLTHVTCPVCRASLEHCKKSSVSWSAILDQLSSRGPLSQMSDHVTVEIEGPSIPELSRHCGAGEASGDQCTTSLRWFKRLISSIVARN